jgi:RimJ/RimL family protein N-acetyltransferase
VTHVALDVLTAAEWPTVRDAAYLSVFGQTRPDGFDRIDFALLALADGCPVGFATVRETDARSVYWQYGGAAEVIRGTSLVQRCYRLFLSWAFERYDNITTLVNADNVPYLRLAMANGFRIIGTRCWDGPVYVELRMRFRDAGKPLGQNES